MTIESHRPATIADLNMVVSMMITAPELLKAATPRQSDKAKRKARRQRSLQKRFLAGRVLAEKTNAE